MDSPFILFMPLPLSRSLSQPYIVEICDSLRGNIFLKFIERLGGDLLPRGGSDKENMAVDCSYIVSLSSLFSLISHFSQR